MTKSMFGWSYPPGCSGSPDDEVAPSALQDAVLELLEAAGIDTETNDKIMVLVEAGEIKKAGGEPPLPL